MRTHWDQERDELIALLQTKPTICAGSVALLRYVAAYVEDNDNGLFQQLSGPLRTAGAAFLPMIADAIEAAPAR